MRHFADELVAWDRVAAGVGGKGGEGDFGGEGAAARGC